MEKEKWSKSPKIFKIISFVLLIICALMTVLYFISKICCSSDTMEWVNFGQYFGSITGLLAFAGVLYSASLSEERANRAEEEMRKREESDLFFKLQNMISEKRYSQSMTNELVRDINSIIFYSFLNEIVAKLNPSTIDSMINAGGLERDYPIVKSFLECIKSVNKNSPLYNADVDFSGSSVDFDHILMNYEHLPSCGIYGERTINHKDLVKLYLFINSCLPESELIYKILQNNQTSFEQLFVQSSSYYNTYKYLILSVSHFCENEMYYKLINAELSDNDKIFLLIYSVILNDNIDMVKLLREKAIIGSINENALFIFDDIIDIPSMINGILDCYINDVAK